jgi:hypothetical protein
LVAELLLLELQVVQLNDEQEVFQRKVPSVLMSDKPIQ